MRVALRGSRCWYPMKSCWNWNITEQVLIIKFHYGYQNVSSILQHWTNRCKGVCLFSSIGFTHMRTIMTRYINFSRFFFVYVLAWAVLNIEMWCCTTKVVHKPSYADRSSKIYFLLPPQWIGFSAAIVFFFSLGVNVVPCEVRAESKHLV